MKHIIYIGSQGLAISIFVLSRATYNVGLETLSSKSRRGEISYQLFSTYIDFYCRIVEAEVEVERNRKPRWLDPLFGLRGLPRWLRRISRERQCWNTRCRLVSVDPTIYMEPSHVSWLIRSSWVTHICVSKRGIGSDNGCSAPSHYPNQC